MASTLDPNKIIGMNGMGNIMNIMKEMSKMDEIGNIMKGWGGGNMADIMKNLNGTTPGLRSKQYRFCS